MRIRIIVSLLIVIMGFTSGIAQSKIKVKEEHGEPFKQKGRTIDDVFELPSGGYWSITSRLEGSGVGGLIFNVAKYKWVYFVQSYDEDMNLIKEKRLNLTFYDKDLAIEKIVRFQKDYYIFLSFENVEKKKTYLFYALFDQYDLRIDGDLTKVAQIKLGNKSNNMTAGSFDISVSDNENYVVIFGNEPQAIPRKRGFFRRSSSNSDDDDGTHIFKFTYWVLDKHFEIVNYEKKHQLKLENSSDKFYVRDYSIDDEGSIYILGKNKIVDELSRSERRSKKTDKWVDINKSAFVIEKINSDGSSIIESTAENELFIDMDILFDNDGNVNLVGLVGEQFYSKLITTGVYRLKLDNNNLEILSEVTAPFESFVLENINDIQEQEANYSKRRKRRVAKREKKLTQEQKDFLEVSKRAALNANFIAYSGLDDNGDAVIILEEQHLEIRTTTTTDANGNTTTTTTYYYHYDDLIMAKFIEDDVVQNYYKKSFVSVNRPLAKSIDASLKEGEVNVMTQGHIVRASGDLSSVKDYELKAFKSRDRIKGMRRKMFTYRKTLSEDVIVAAAQRGRKLVWYLISID